MRAITAAAAFEAAMSFAIPQADAFGDAPWCAVKNFGSDVVWDCQYRSAEDCAPHVIAGDRSFCNLNPRSGAAAGPAAPAPRDHRKHSAVAR